VTPFTIPTPDGQTLYAWHILPIDTYLRNEEALSSVEPPKGPVEDFTQTLSFKLLASTSSPARVVINCEL
jgi:abhydrolase domain-containing protein 12